MKESLRILFVNSEISPYTKESAISKTGRHLPQGIQEAGCEIRTFMPKYGCVNERRNQLHEVIRLSGMNIVVKDIDRPLIIKVASISSARMQIYFIDNEDYFQRKFVYKDDNDSFFQDNDERAIFFARGVMETVKKLRWQPDIIHCHGWMSNFIPIYLKRSYNQDPIFKHSKAVLSIYKESVHSQDLSPDIIKKAVVPGLAAKDLDQINSTNGINLAKMAIQYSDGIVIGSENMDTDIMNIIEVSEKPVLGYFDVTQPDPDNIQSYKNFYKQILTKDDKKV